MKHLLFEKIDDSKYEIFESSEEYSLGDYQGSLEFDEEQDAWVYYFCSISGDEGVTYTEDIDETIEMIQDEYQDFIQEIGIFER
ncbi:hypothetical protein [Lactobacillus jensenii]|jgi:hypothetical protein|uniref:hypothetical protein n=1 Tax=Lactobacillus jensenii TaxID=109790 RepID=UPI00065E3DDA|nr:hypothetical protein [Lactobacillus jensenii]MCF1843479.1 hypothetical protein [Lactobacillus jensenii]TVV06250.1 hypothetical protein FOF79_00135 [Lactobacillus jensenii]DAQ86111.1 MAG TPA: protein of unknown function (DUF1902) [Caudoviricetes sp.]